MTTFYELSIEMSDSTISNLSIRLILSKLKPNHIDIEVIQRERSIEIMVNIEIDRSRSSFSDIEIELSRYIDISEAER